MKLHRLSLFASVLALSTLTVSAASWWEEMDYGRFLSATFNDNGGKTVDQNGKVKEGNGKTTLDNAERIATNKGIAVKIGKAGDAGLIFDTELLRVTGGWTGGWLKLKGVVFDGGHGPNPSAPSNAQIFFGTHANTPGWTKGSDFKDPRKIPTGPKQSEVKAGEPRFADVPFGPLPKEWAKVREKAPAIFKGKSGWTTPLRATNRVLAGPFKTNEEARSFVNALSKEGLSAFVFTSEAGQKITKLPAK